MQHYKQKITLIIGLMAGVLLTGCSALSEKSVIKPVVKETVKHYKRINDFPTRDRVEYVFNCIAKHGGKLEYVVQYACGCKIDKIAEKLSFAEYEAATTFTMLRSTPGEKGATFRDPKQSKRLRMRLKDAEIYAESQCFVS